MTGYRDYGFSESGSTSGCAGEALAAKYVAIVKALSGVRSVCDLGCGNGYLASLMGQLGLNVIGVDASATGLDLANRNYSAPNVSFIQANLDDSDLLERVGAKFDAVISSDVVEHLYRPASLLESARSILAPSGYLVVGTPYHGYLKNLALAVLGRWDAHHGPNWDGGHIKFFSVSTLGDLVQKHGFVDARFEFYGRAPLLWKNMICIARKGA